ncbi:MAG: electron transfer flavoprotein subunit beta/FixA family protein [Promethearchaeota archaeon]
MKFIVCVKQVPETNDLKLDINANKVMKTGISTIINPFDQFALEEAIKIKQEGDEIIAISIGDAETKSTLMRCLALGADRGILLDDEKFQDSDTFVTAKILATAINKIGEYKIIFCGNSTFDTGSSQVGPELAALLNIPQVTYAENVEGVQNGKIKIKAQTDEGYNLVESELPLVITAIPPSSFQPSIPPLPKILAARKKSYDVWNMEDIGGEATQYGSTGSLIKIVKLYTPPKREEGIVITDEPNVAVEKLMDLLNKDKVI